MTKENFPLADATTFARSPLEGANLTTRAPQVIAVEPGVRSALQLYQWWTLPSGQVVEVRKIEGEHQPEVVVRNINENSEMAPGEYKLRLTFLVRFCKQVRVAR